MHGCVWGGNQLSQSCHHINSSNNLPQHAHIQSSYYLLEVSGPFEHLLVLETPLHSAGQVCQS